MTEDFFDSFYKTTEPPISDTIPYVHIEKLNIDALCSLGVSNTKECE